MIDAIDIVGVLRSPPLIGPYRPLACIGGDRGVSRACPPGLDPRARLAGRPWKISQALPSRGVPPHTHRPCGTHTARTKILRSEGGGRGLGLAAGSRVWGSCV